MIAHDRGGRPLSDSTVRNQVGRVLKKSAASLAEKSLAKALTGDSAAMLACVQLLKMSMQTDAKKSKLE